MLRVYALIGVLAAFLGLTAWGYIGHQSAKHEKTVSASLRTQVSGLAQAVKDSEAERKRIAIVSRELTERLKAQAALVAAQKKELNEALKANPDWAAAPVPDGVWDSLGVRGTAARAPQPGPGVDGPGSGAAAAGQDKR